MARIRLSVGDVVAFRRNVLQRMGNRRFDADARGVVVSVEDHVVAIDWRGTWIPSESGNTCRWHPAANLTRVRADGAVAEAA